MAALSTIIAGVGVAASVAGTGMSVYGQMQASAAQRKAEEQRKRAMELDATRRKREMIRQAQLARSTALTTATSQGASEGSVLGGAYGGVEGRSGVNQLGVNQNLMIGRSIFDANAERDSAMGFAQTGQGLAGLGGALVKNYDTIHRVGTYFGFGRNNGAFNPFAYG